MVTNENRSRKPAEATTTSGESGGAARRSNAEEGPDLWNWALIAIAAAGTALGVLKHMEAKEHATAADQAKKRASAYNADAQAARQHAQTMEAKATRERERAVLAETRVRKLAIEVAHHANRLIAGLLREAIPTLRFDGCVAAATNGVEIRIDMTWLLSGIVDPAKEEGAIFGRIIGVLAHEWFHFLERRST